MFRWFSRKKEIKEIREEVKNSFELVKNDINGIGNWIKHLHSEKESHKNEINELKEILSTVKKEVEEIKNFVSSFENSNSQELFKTPKQVFKKQPGVYAVQTGVQTGVQTPNLEQFSVIERAILWVLLNTDMKLSYEDLAAVLGKEKTTIRGQVNAIKQKNKEIIHEITEKNNKKRVYIPENIKEKLLKKAKVRVRKKKGE